MAIKLASLFIQLGADSAQLQTEFKKAQKKADTFGSKMKAVGATAEKAMIGLSVATTGVVVGLGAVYASTAPLIDSLAKTSAKLGTTVTGLQAAQYAGEKAGISVTTMNTALQRQTRRLAEAAQGTGIAKDAIKELGLNAQALSEMRPEQALEALVTQLQDIPSQADRVRLAFKIFDTEGVGLVNLLPEALADARDRLIDVGVALTKVDAAKVEAANDAISDMKLLTQGMRNRITVALAEPITLVAESLFESARQSEYFRGSMDGLVKQSLIGISKVTGAMSTVLEYVSGTPEVAWGGMIGFMLAGKAGFAIGSVIGSTAGVIRGMFNDIKNAFDDSKTQVEKYADRLDYVNAQIDSYTAGIGQFANIGGVFDNHIAKLVEEKEQLEILLNRQADLGKISRERLTETVGIASALGDAMSAVSQATGEAAEKMGTLAMEAKNAPLIDIPDLSGFANQARLGEEVNPYPKTGETAALIGEYKNYQQLRVQSEEEANRQISSIRGGYLNTWLAQQQQFQAIWTEFNAAGSKDRFKILSSELGGALSELGNYSKTWFKINQAMGVANAVVNIAEGITAALKLPPPASYIAAAKTAIMGAAQLMKIKKAKYGQGASVTVPSVSNTTPGFNVNATETESNNDDDGGGQTVYVHVYPATGASQDEIDRQIRQSIERNVARGEIKSSATIEVSR